MMMSLSSSTPIDMEDLMVSSTLTDREISMGLMRDIVWQTAERFYSLSERGLTVH
jgi:hypothetical protein